MEQLHLSSMALMMCITVACSSATATAQSGTHQTAIFAGGCFWCMEKPFEHIPGVISVISGYTAGHSLHPTYENYAQGGHLEAIKIEYKPEMVTYTQLLDVFWHQINPTDAGGQFVDRGSQYTSAIFYLNEQQRTEAEASKHALEKSGRFHKPIITPIKPAKPFWQAEAYHQDFYKTHSVRYWYYRSHSGRDQFLEQVWGKEDHAPMQQKTLREKLTPLQYQVTQEQGTEPAFNNAYWDNKQAGIYVDIVSGEPLFTSLNKFKSGTGWPSFSKPLVAENVIEREDRSFFMVRTEVHSAKGDSHLGHLFHDGSQPTGLRYCINSAALRFVPVNKLKQNGYDQFLSMFEK